MIYKSLYKVQPCFNKQNVHKNLPNFMIYKSLYIYPKGKYHIGTALYQEIYSNTTQIETQFLFLMNLTKQKKVSYFFEKQQPTNLIKENLCNHPTNKEIKILKKSNCSRFLPSVEFGINQKQEMKTAANEFT